MHAVHDRNINSSSEGGPGGSEKGTRAPRRTPNGAYVNTTGEFDVPLAVTSSEFNYNSLSLSKVVDEINGRTKLKVKLGSQSASLRPGQLKSAPVLVFNGHRAFTLSKEQRDAVRQFVAQGGVVWADFTGGEFILTEQRPRMQSRPEVVPLGQGDAVVFAVNQRPVRGSRGCYRVKLRHGVSRVRSGCRHTAGIIFHDAR